MGVKLVPTPFSTNFRACEMMGRVVVFVWTEMDVVVVCGESV